MEITKENEFTTDSSTDTILTKKGHEKTFFQKKLNNVLKKSPVEEVIKDLIKLHYLRIASKDESKYVLVEIYELLGSEKFAELIEIINGRTVKFPDRESFKESVQIALCYYFKYIKHKKWDEIKEILQDDDVSSVKYGINCNKLSQFINEMSAKMISEKGTPND